VRDNGLSKRSDATLIGLALALCALGLVLIYAATISQPALRGLPVRQVFWILMGLVAMFLAAALDYQGVVLKGYTLYVICCVFLVVLLFTAKRSQYGAASWFNLKFFYVQPAEISKVALILALARYLSGKAGDLGRFSDILPALGLSALMMGLILRQPDLGTALVMLPVTFAMLYVAGARWWHLALIGGSMAGSVPLLWPLLKEYQKNRILTFLDPSHDALGAGYNAIQSQIAAGSGGWFGQGFLKGTQSQLHFVPFHHTDFIVSVLGEEWGLAGGFMLLALELGLLARLAHIAARSRSLAGSLICVGLLAWLGTQALINIGMSLGVMPVTGLPLPLVSYGGSSTVASLAGIGLVLSVYKESLGA
jgi:rod shape determining protein RodA